MARTPKITYTTTTDINEVHEAYEHGNQHEEAGGYDSYHGYGSGGPLNYREVETRITCYVGEIILSHARLTDAEWEENPASSTITWEDPKGQYHIMHVE